MSGDPVRFEETLNRIGAVLGSELDLDRLVQLLTDEATLLCGAQFGAFFYNVTDASGESYMLYTISGVPREAFSQFPMPRNTAVFAPTFSGEAVVRSDDITKDPRYGKNGPYCGMPKGHLPVCSYLAVPVISRRGSVIGGLFFGHPEAARFSERDERLIVAVAAQASIAIDNARLYAEATTARVQAERMEERFRFLASAGEALAESLDYELTLRRVAELSVPRMADWCSVTVLDRNGVFRRVAVVHKDKSKREFIDLYERAFPPEQHRAGGMVEVVQARRASLQPVVTDEDLQRAAQSEDHLRVLRGLGCTSCMMVPILARGEPLGVISFVMGDGTRSYGDDDLVVAQELAHRAGLAVDNARLFRETRAREETTTFLAAASAILGSSLDYETTLRSVANIVVPRFADWCAVDIVGRDGKIAQLAVAHVDPNKVALAREYNRRWPPDHSAATGVGSVVRTGKSELYADIPDEMLVAATRDAEHLRVARELGLRSALVVPLSARGRTLGALTLVWAESGRRYDQADVALMEELGRRAGAAVDNAILYDEAQRAVQLRDDFISIASHELKTPLTTLQLQVGAIQRGFERDATPPPEKLVAKIGLVDRQVDRLGTLVNALLDVSRATAGRLQLTLEPVDVAQLIRDVVGRLQPDLTSARCPVTLELEPDVVGQLDRLRVDQIVTNFIANAIKYGAGRPIEIAAARRGGDVVISVTDHGIGLDEGDHARVFDRFARAVSAESFAGLGLGLWIVRVYVEAMGGTVRVQSQLGEGATFSAALPLNAKA